MKIGAVPAACCSGHEIAQAASVPPSADRRTPVAVTSGRCFSAGFTGPSAESVVGLWWGAEFIAQARRNGAVDVGDAEPSAQLRADHRATGEAHHVVLRVEGDDHTAGELWRLPRDARTFL